MTRLLAQKFQNTAILTVNDCLMVQNMDSKRTVCKSLVNVVKNWIEKKKKNYTLNVVVVKS